MKEYLGKEGFRQLVKLVRDALKGKQDTITGSAGQVVGFDSAGKAVAAEVGGTNILRGTRNIIISDSSGSDWSQGTFHFIKQSSDIILENIDVIAPNPAIIQGIHFKKDGQSILYGNFVQDKIPLIAGQTYTLSCYVKGEGRLNLIAGASGNYTSKSIPFKYDNWTRVSYTFILKENQLDNGKTSCRYATDGDGSLDFTVCGFKLEVGSIATDWSPAPEDIAYKSELAVQSNLNLTSQYEVLRADTDFLLTIGGYL